MDAGCEIRGLAGCRAIWRVSGGSEISGELLIDAGMPERPLTDPLAL